jgi:uncharacterized membrane protein
MRHVLRFLFRRVSYDLTKGLLARPGAITVAYALVAVGMVLAERALPGVTELASRAAGIRHEDVAASQLILATIAGSMMTTVAVVFSVLIMALSLASLQFSPRILTSFMGDKPTQNTLGIFMGTFVYSLLVLRTVQGGAEPFVPAASVSLAMALAVGALASLVYFIHHIAHAIHANHIIDRIAEETLQVIDEEFPTVVGRADSHPEDTGPPPAVPASAIPVEATASGYVQLCNRERLLELARRNDLTIYQEHGVGEFVVRGNPLVSIVSKRPITDEIREVCVECFDLGQTRTLQQDFQFGIRQIVDMALKAISPAINDPSTANTCLDHLARILCHLARRRILPLEMRDPETGKLLMVRHASTFRGSIDLAFNQLRQYGRGDMAVALRMMRALTEIAVATDHRPHQQRALHHARLLEQGLSTNFVSDDREEFEARLATLRARVEQERASQETARPTL